MDRHILRKIEQYTGQKVEATVIEGFEPKRPINMNAPDGKRGKSRGRNTGSSDGHKPGSSRGYQPRGNGGSNEKGRSFGERAASDRPFSGRTNSDETPNSSRSFGNRPSTNNRPNGDRPERSNKTRYVDKQASTAQGQEVNGNSVSYTKDTNMQFAKELARGLGNGRNNDRARTNGVANKGSAKISNEKFGKPRGQFSNERSRTNTSPSGDHTPRRPNTDGARRSRNFA